MASATRDPYSFRPSDAASVSGASSSTTSSGDRKVKLRCSYGGKILHRLSDGALRYVGGVSRIVAVSRDSTLPEIMRKMAEAYGGPVVLRYQLPDEDLDALITVSTAEDLENMMEECDKLAVDNPNAKLRVFLCSPAETAGAGTDPLAAYSDFQDGSTRYLEAVNGLDSVIRRRDSATSLSSTQNSDGLTAAEAVAKEGMSPPHVSPTAKSSQDASKFDFGAQDMPNLLPITVSSDQTEFSTVSQSEVPYVVPSQSEILNSIQAELPSVTPFVPQPYLDQHIPMMNPQPFQVIGLPPQINVIPVLPHTYMAPAQSNTPRPQVVNGMTKLDPKIESNGGKIAKIPFDPRLQPLSQLPPLPPPHLLAPTVERRQVLLSSQGLTVGSPDCSSCQTALPHVRSDPVINAQDKGLKHAFSETNSILYSGNSEDLPRKAPQTTEVLLPVDHGIETQPVNLVEAIPPRTFGCSVINQEIPQIRGKAIVNSTNLESVRVFVPPISTCLPSTLQATNISNPEKIPNADILQQRQELPLNPDHSNILFKPASLAMAPKPHGTFIVPQQSHVEDSLQYQVQLPQQTGHHKYPINPDFISKPFVSDASLVGESGFLEDGQAIHGTLPAFSYGCVTPINGIMGTLCMNPPGNPGFTDQPRPAVFADISQNLKPEPPLIMVNSHNTGPLDRGNELSIRNPLITYLVGPEGNDGFLTHQVPSMSNDAYQQNAQLSNASHTPDIGRNYGPYPYHTEARGGPREMVNYVGHTYTNCSINGNLIVGMNNDVLNVQLQQALSFEPLVSNKHTQKKFDNSLMPPRPSNVSCKQSVVTEDFHNCDHPLSIGSEITHPSDGVSNHNAHSDVAHPAKDMEDAYVKQDMQTIEGSMPTSVHQLSEVPIPVLNSHAIKDIVPSSDDECGNIGKKTEIDEQTETNAKPSEKKRNGFLNTDDIEHLQVIKYNDLEELQELGSGTFGTVYYGKWRGTDVAIKRINDSFFSGKLSEQERARADFWNEACILASLHHPNVVAFYGIVLDGPGESIATVTEFMVNGSLRRALQKNEKMFDSRRRLFITMDVAFGMEYLHSKNIIHFDLKSDNLLVNLRDLQRPICKVGDLGLSKVKYDTLMSGGMRGTLPWMAPELLGGKDNKCSEKVDVFSFGIVMWEIITGEEPYKDMHYGAIIGGIMTDTLRPSVPESCDPDWRSLMEQCWATEPSQRPSFTEIASRLRAMEASLPQKG